MEDAGFCVETRRMRLFCLKYVRCQLPGKRVWGGRGTFTTIVGFSRSSIGSPEAPRLRFLESDDETWSLAILFSEPSEVGVRIPDIGRDASDVGQTREGMLRGY